MMHTISPSETQMLNSINQREHSNPKMHYEYSAPKATSPPRKQSSRSMAICFAGSALNDVNELQNHISIRTGNTLKRAHTATTPITSFMDSFDGFAYEQSDDSCPSRLIQNSSRTSSTSSVHTITDEVDLSTAKVYAIDPENLYAGILVKKRSGRGREHWAVQTSESDASFVRCETCAALPNGQTLSRHCAVRREITPIPRDMVSQRIVGHQALLCIPSWDNIRLKSLRKHSETVAGIIL
ncbi:hypothetical protein SARC_12822 [Sphaeroforma arctica JP610]|uniref:Uncharacterized protein n=1 Tax=Sphaeroforma arctica JP610 TaxID=667725 RepID=A0A0L0FD10_9EUKA|nr:hypothetical protein SARC_12822 [Sphaeroforma arctica JP610]KNC74637.1 hypothetical protein SARC_12822 [Sphaeroforma arctica JP610]|eukprot:XP_014148539.1 hypothetical protein SARC_12822 [Sphaeroforma arctica JP610]